MIKHALLALPLLALFLSGCDPTDGPVTFAVEIRNVSTPTTLAPSPGAGSAVPLAPGVWAVHRAPAPLFATGVPDRGRGLEALAEDGNPATLAAFLGDVEEIDSGGFNTPAGAAAPAPIGPGGRYRFQITARLGDRLSFATMFVPSNDLFYAPNEAGIALFAPDGTPVHGSVTGQVRLWDAGTEVNQAPGVGPDQAPRQAGPNVGAVEDGVVRLVDDGYTYPSVSSVIHVTVTPQP